MANGKKKIPHKRVTNLLKDFAAYILIGLAALIFFVNVSGGGKSGDDIPISQVVNDVKDGKVDKLVLENDRINVQYKEGKKNTYSRKEPGESIYNILESSGVD